MNNQGPLFSFFKTSASRDGQNQNLNVEVLEDRMMLSAVDIVAAGATGGENMELLVNDQVVRTYESIGGDYDNREFWTFHYETNQQLSADQISLRFTNDAWDPSTNLDRNLFVDKIVVDGVDFEAEDRSSHVSAAWVDGGIKSGFLETEVLNVNGQIDFASRNTVGQTQLDITARGATGDELFELVVDEEVVAVYQAATFNQVFTHSSAASISLDDVKIRFINDTFAPELNYDSNLTVMSVMLTDSNGSEQFNTDDESVYSTGTWTPEDGVTSGYGRGDTLHSNGYFKFDAEKSDAVIEWNKVFNDMLVGNEELQNPGYASRAMAMMNLAIFDSVAITTGNADAFYNYDNLPGFGQGDSTEAVASHAAYTVLSSLYSGQQAALNGYLTEILNGDTSGSQLGTAIGETIIAARANDGANAIADFTYGSGPGVFQADPLNPNVPVWGPSWGNVETFAISSAEQYAPITTPPLTSAEYARSYNEVKELGSVDSTSRTADQTEAGIFWAYDRGGMGTPMSLFGEVLETVAVQEGNTFEENATLFAQASVAMADAGIVAWHTKFSEEFWRPVTAIIAGDTDGNPLTEADPDWTALGAPDGGGDIIGFTPQFPTYISGHATFGGAVFGALQNFYGTDDISFDLNSKELEILMQDPELQAAYGLNLDDASRTFNSFSEAMAENGRSRVYLGIHFDFDDLVGQDVGQQVASDIFWNFSATPGHQYGETITVTANGTAPGAAFKVYANGVDLGTFQAGLNSSTFQLEIPESINAQYISVEFTNDSYVANQYDRNLVVESVQIGDVVLTTDSSDVYSTGTWRAEDGVTEGFGRGNVLHSNGFFRFQV